MRCACWGICLFLHSLFRVLLAAASIAHACPTSSSIYSLTACIDSQQQRKAAGAPDVVAGLEEGRGAAGLPSRAEMEAEDNYRRRHHSAPAMQAKQVGMASSWGMGRT